MQTHELKPKHSSKGKKRIGRGGKKGTYSGKGGKGQSARSGRKMVPIIRELIKRYPKLKGYRALNLKEYVAVVNLDSLSKNFKESEVVNPSSLIEKGIVSKIKNRIPRVKVLSKGTLDKKLVFEGCEISETAKKSIEKVGGTVK